MTEETKTEEVMDRKLIEEMVVFAVNSTAWSIYKHYVEEKDLGEGFFDNLYGDAMGIRLTQHNTDMIKVMIEEAIENGFIENDIDDSAFQLGVPMVMITLTQKGKDHIKENTRQAFIDHFQGIIDHIMKIANDG
jgi:hypothetical protein